jgi:hypothetical protein
MPSEAFEALLAQIWHHVWGLGALGLVVVGPLPLGLVFALAHLGPRPTPRAQRAVLVATAWLSLQTFLALGLGLVHRLTPGHVLAAEALLLALGLLAVTRQRAALAVVWSSLRWPGSAEGMILVCLVTVAAWLLHQTVTIPISEYDSLAYHLPAVASWYRSGTLDMLGQGSVDYYPYDFELVSLLFVLPFRGHFVVGLAQLLAWTLYGLAIHAMATRLGARPLHGLLAALLALTQPVVLHLVVDTLQVDLAFAAAVLIAVYVGMGYAARELHWSLLVLAGAWVVGAKASGFGYLGVIVLMIVIVRMRRIAFGPATTEDESRTPPTGVVVLSVVVAVVNAGFWYARNVMTAGNPLGLVGVKVFGIPILTGPMDASELGRSSLAAVFRVFELGDWVILLKALALNLGLPFALLAVGVLMLAAGREGRPVWRDPGAVVALALGGACAALYASTPFSGDDVGTYGWRVTPWIGQALRYALPAAGMLAVAAALGMARLTRFDNGLAVVAMTAAVLALPRHRLAALLLFAVLSLAILRRYGLSRWSRRLVSCAAIPLLIATSFPLRNAKDAVYAQMFPVAAYVDHYIAPGEKIGLLVTNRAFTFFGTRLTADVVFVPTGDGDVSRWVQMLQARQVRFIGVGPILEDWWLSSDEIRWLDGGDRRFERVHGTDYRRGSVLYRLREASAADGGPR